MNKVILNISTILLLFLGTSSFSQEKQSKDLVEVNALAEKMFEDTNNKDFDSLLEMTHPKLFDLVSKEQMKEIFISTFEGNSEYSINLPELGTKDFILSEVFEVEKDSLKFAFISYDMKMKMTFKNEEFDQEAKKMMKLVMQGKGIDIEFLTDNQLRMLMKDSITIAIKDKDTDNEWKIINYEADSPMMYSLLKLSVLEKAKEYKQSLMLKRKKTNEE